MYAFLKPLVREDMVNRFLRIAFNHGDAALIAVALAVLTVACFS